MKQITLYSSIKMLPYSVFTEEVCYRAMVKMINDEISESKLNLSDYTENDVRKHVIFDLDDYYNWASQWIEDARYQIKYWNQWSEQPVTQSHTNRIIEFMSSCLRENNAGKQIIEKFLENKHKNNLNFITSYYYE